MKASLQIDSRSFDRTLRTYQRATGKDIPEVVNRAALNLAFRSAQFTKEADKSAIRSLTGVENPYALVNWNATRLGKRHPKRADMDAAVQKLINARVAVAGFIRRGWIQAGRRIKERSGVSAGVRIPGMTGRKGKGTGRIARQAIVSFAEIINFSTSKSKSSGRALEKFAGDGLRKAIRFVSADMMAYAERKLAQRAREFNA